MGPIMIIVIVDDAGGSPPGTIPNDNGWSGGWEPTPV